MVKEITQNDDCSINFFKKSLIKPKVYQWRNWQEQRKIQTNFDQGMSKPKENIVKEFKRQRQSEGQKENNLNQRK